MFGHRVEPGGNRLLGFFGAQAVEPVGVLGAPHQGVELEMSVILFSPVVTGVATGPIVTAAGSFDRGPLTFVFGGNLVPVGTKIALNLAAGSNVTQEFGTTFCKRSRLSHGCKRSSQGNRRENSLLHEPTSFLRCTNQ